MRAAMLSSLYYGYHNVAYVSRVNGNGGTMISLVSILPSEAILFRVIAKGKLRIRSARKYC
jgi:hypothetical protein